MDKETHTAQHQKTFHVRADEIDYSGRAKTESILNYMQESVSEQAFMQGYAVPDLMKKNRTWVMSRYHVRIHSYPKLWDKITVTTWPSALQERFALREFTAEGDQEPVARAASSWLVIDLDTRKPVSPEPHFSALQLYPKRALDTDFPALPALKTAKTEKIFPVYKTDLDLNRHVNSVVYIHWALETVPEEVLFKMQAVEIEVQYRAEVFYGDRILSRAARQKDGFFLHQLRRASDDAELTRLRTRWA
jgi:medium-chain acyl-[acyl-carrier-protein] hydrolase